MLNYRHLHYFWVVGKEGSFSRAAERLDMAVQTVSTQVRALETQLGHQLLRPAGRGVELTDMGQLVLKRADAIFQAGVELLHEVGQQARDRKLRLSVGLSDGISKLAAHALLEPVLAMPGLHLVCHEGEFEQLLGELVMHQIDLVLAEQPAPSGPSLRLHSERLQRSPVDWLGPRAFVNTRTQAAFPAVLETLPVLLPTGHSMLRTALDLWFEHERLRPNVVGEFEDSALMAVFATRGMGVFPVSRAGERDIGLRTGLRRLGHAETVQEEIYMVYPRRKVPHPALEALLRHTGHQEPVP